MSIIQYGVRCRRCGDRIFSNSRHDFVWCRCGATYVDGGFDYVKFGLSEGVGMPEQIQRTLKARPKRRFRW